MKILVRAVFPLGGFGFDNVRRRRDGDEFTIDEDQFDDGWMVRVEESGEPDPSLIATEDDFEAEVDD